jgi:hypothetical protein
MSCTIKTKSNRQVITRASVEALKDRLPTATGTRSTATEADILAHQARIDKKVALDIRMGRTVERSEVS